MVIYRYLMFEKITILVDEPINTWIQQQGRKFKVSSFIRELLHDYIALKQSEVKSDS